MYDMYPEAWPATVVTTPAPPPRRRARRSHSVQPAVLARQKRAEPRPDAAPSDGPGMTDGPGTTP